MKSKASILSLLFFSSQFSFAANYKLTVDGEIYDLNLDQESQIKIGRKNVSVLLEKKDTFLFSSDTFSFKHPKEYNPSKISLGEGVYQTSVTAPTGGVVLIQEHLRAPPQSNFIDIAINDMIREEKGSGYKIESNQDHLTLTDGRVLRGKIVTSHYEGYSVKRYFYTYSFINSGFFIMTQSFYENGVSEDAKIINAIIKSLELSTNKS